MTPHRRPAARLRRPRLARRGRAVHVQPHGARALRRARRAGVSALPDDRRVRRRCSGIADGDRARSSSRRSRRAGPRRRRSRVGMRYWDPYIADAMRRSKDAGCERIVTRVAVAVRVQGRLRRVPRGGRTRPPRSSGHRGRRGAADRRRCPSFDEFFAGATAYALDAARAQRGRAGRRSPRTACRCPISSRTTPTWRPASGPRRPVAERLGLMPGTERGRADRCSVFERSARSRAAPWFLAYQSKGARAGRLARPGPRRRDRCVRRRGSPPPSSCARSGS